MGPQPAQQLETGHARQHLIQQQHGGWPEKESRQRRFSVHKGRHRKTFACQNKTEERSQSRIILNNGDGEGYGFKARQQL